MLSISYDKSSKPPESLEEPRPQQYCKPPPIAKSSFILYFAMIGISKKLLEKVDLSGRDI